MADEDEFRFLAEEAAEVGRRVSVDGEPVKSVVAHLQGHPLVERVRYPTLPGSPSAAIAQWYLPDGGGAIVSFDIVGGVDAGRIFVDGVELFSHLADIGDVRSLIIHPASTTNSGQPPEQRLAAGVGPGLIRLSIGIEDAVDLIADLETGFAAVTAALRTDHR